MSEQTCWIGIDVSKAALDVAVRLSGTRWQQRNDGAGIDALVEQCVALAPEGIVLEATGGFEMGVAAAPTGWTHRSWRTSVRRSTPRYDLYRMRPRVR